MSVLASLAARRQQIMAAAPRRAAPVVNVHQLAAATAARAINAAQRPPAPRPTQGPNVNAGVPTGAPATDVGWMNALAGQTKRLYYRSR